VCQIREEEDLVAKVEDVRGTNSQNEEEEIKK